MATLLIELFGMRLRSNSKVDEAKQHFEVMNDLNLRLKDIDKERALPDVVMGVLMCMSLPNDMEQVRYRRLSGPSKELTSINVRDDVISLLRRMAVTGDLADSDTGQAMTADRSLRRRGAFTGRCFGCGNTGHRAADCRSKGNDTSQGNANIAMLSVAQSSGKGAPRKGLRHWVLDGAVTCRHVSTNLAHFKGALKKFDKDKRPSIGGVGGARIDVHGKGVVTLKAATGQIVTLKDVNYAPDGVVNLFAVRAALSKLGKGSEHRETVRSLKILSAAGKVLLTASLRQGLLYADLSSEQDFLLRGGALALLSKDPNQGQPPGAVSMDLAHERLGHLCEQTLSAMETKKCVDGLRIAVDSNKATKSKCRTCVEANLHVSKIPERRTRQLRPFR